jgi:hypothetical protein
MATNIDLSKLNAADVLVDSSLEEYQRLIDFFYLEQLVPLNASMFVMEKILQFPLHLLVNPEDTVFIQLVLNNFFQACLLTVTRLATDTGKDLYTLRHFKNWVWENVKAEYKETFQATLRQVRFDNATETILAKARQLRHGRIAHIKRAYALGSLEQERLHFQELGKLRDEFNSLLDVLSFNVGHAMLPLQYDPNVQHPTGVDGRSDIERFLDTLARGSHLLNLPETNPDHWSIFRGTLSQQDLETLHRYRVKFGLPTA